jgi:hypothetical protein
MSDASMSDAAELRALIREVIRDVLPNGLPVTETVNLSTDADLASFVARLLDLSPEEREEIRSGRKRFRLAGPAAAGAAAAGPAAGARAGEVRRIERGAVTEAVVSQAARAGERLVLGRGAVLTPLARDRARASGVEIEKER